jgi:hypothetical protein
VVPTGARPWIFNQHDSSEAKEKYGKRIRKYQRVFEDGDKGIIPA